MPTRTPRSSCPPTHWRACTMVVTLLLAGACGGTAGTPSPSDPTPTAVAPTPTTPASAAQATSTPRPSATAAPVATATRAPARWVRAGTMHLAHVAPAVIELGDGRVLAIGSSITDTYRGGPPDESTRVVEIWDPVTAAWKSGPPLNNPRDWFSAVALPDGGALVIGGINADMASYSSAYRFDPHTSAWVKTGLLGTARFSAAAVVLADGRVLVMGGRFSRGSNDYGAASADGVVLAGYRDEADVDPGPPGRLLALAEIYDPTTDVWSPTGPMHWARSGASAVRLGDGRVLVYGGNDQEGGEGSAETFDPATGRFTVAPRIPVPTPTQLESLGVTGAGDHLALNGTGTGVLAGLPDGHALAIGLRWWGANLTVEGNARFDPATNAWTIDRTSLYVGREDPTTGNIVAHWGTQRPTEAAARLPDGRLIFVDVEAGRRVDVLDGRTGRWSRLPSLPANMAGATGVGLLDGSLLLVPGAGRYTDAYRYVP